MSKDRNRLLVCTRGKHCPKNGSLKIFEHLEQETSTLGIEIEVLASKCLGMCKHGPAAVLLPEKKKYREVDKKKCKKILSRASKPSDKKKKKHD
ncbi:MAG TPA: (2Fe-2S) ferredoxin domain-containing protein [Candidatus Melainabacteria bacterium]|nr:(2Fe-2S) ferredoxin domain-containing protein [Candidatus Melainabacteria bacterium]HMP51891.1 (2Fe-2S) ferredoxin domain-containing protein [Candidatus Melainabacteria bacterium]